MIATVGPPSRRYQGPGLPGTAASLPVTGRMPLPRRIGRMDPIELDAGSVQLRPWRDDDVDAVGGAG